MTRREYAKLTSSSAYRDGIALDLLDAPLQLRDCNRDKSPSGARLPSPYQAIESLASVKSEERYEG